MKVRNRSIASPPPLSPRVHVLEPRVPRVVGRKPVGSKLHKSRVQRISKLSRSFPDQLRPIGLSNRGENHCWRNATLQALMHAPLFIDWLQSVRNFAVSQHLDHICPAGPQDCLLCDSLRLATIYWSLGRSKRFVNLARNRIHQTIQNTAFTELPTWAYGADEQGDPHELFGHVLQRLLYREMPDNPSLDALFCVNLVDSSTCHNCKRLKRDQVNDHWGLSLGFGDVIAGPDGLEEPAVTLDSMLDRCFEGFESSRECEKGCKAKCDHTRKPRIDAAPAVLMLHLQRYTSTEKIFVPVNFPEKLDISRYQHNAIPRRQRNLRYTLSSVLYHAGADTHAGHYIAAVRGPEGDFYVDDAEVTRLEPDEILWEQRVYGEESDELFTPYILMYVRDEARPVDRPTTARKKR